MPQLEHRIHGLLMLSCQECLRSIPFSVSKQNSLGGVTLSSISPIVHGGPNMPTGANTTNVRALTFELHDGRSDPEPADFASRCRYWDGSEMAVHVACAASIEELYALIDEFCELEFPGEAIAKVFIKAPLTVENGVIQFRFN